jgi:hypothetical protein
MVGSVFKFGADTTEYNKAVEAMPRKIKQAAQQIEANTNSISAGFGKLQSVMASVGVAFSGTIIIAEIRRVMEHFDRVNDLAVRFGTSAESIQRVGEAAKLAGSDIDMVARAMTKAGVAATQAVNEGGAAAETFERAGINAREFERASLDKKLLTVAEAFKAANGNASKQNEILKLIGMRAADLIPLISNVDGLRSAMADASVVSDEAVKKIADANDALEKVSLQAQASITAPVIVFFTSLAERFLDVAKNASAAEMAMRALAAPFTFGESLRAGGQTPEERQSEADKEQALTNLRNRGQLPQTTPSDMTMRQEAEMELVVLREVAKIERERAEAKQKTIQSQQQLTAETEETAKASNADKQASEEKKALSQEIARINLQIKEAQAAGNDALAADLTEFKDLLEAGIKYEGDMEMAARDVNAAYKERLRLKDQEIAKQQAGIEAELRHAEAMAFGTDEAKAKAEWMAEYNRRIKDGATDEQARRFANAETYEPPATTTTAAARGGSGGGTSAPKPTTALDALRKAAETDARARADLFRIEADKNRRTERVSELMDGGFLSSAANTQLRAERNAEKRAQDLMTRRSATDALFGADSPLKNMGELQNRFRQENPFGRREDFDRFVSEQAKSETERARETSAPTTGAGAGPAPSSPESALMQTVKQIYEVLTRSDGIHDRLPVRSLA